MWDFSNLLSFSQQRKTIFKESSIVPSIVTRNTINRDVEKEAEFYKVLNYVGQQATTIDYSAKLPVSHLVSYCVFFIIIQFISV